MARVLLIQMPFLSINTPNLGYSILKACLEKAGYECEIIYLNIEFASRIGKELYTIISEQVPQQLLLGDLIFSPCLYNTEITTKHIEALVNHFKEIVGQRKALEYDKIIEEFPNLVREGAKLVYDVVERVDWSQYGMIGFGTMFQTIPSLAMASCIKARNAASKIVFGGCNCDGEMGEYLFKSFPFIDFMCRGEGEVLIVELAKHIFESAIEASEIQGLVWRNNGEAICNGQRTAPIKNLDDTPYTSYRDWIMQLEAYNIHDPSELRLPIETSRGCWYGEKRQCSFCGLNGETIEYRSKSPERALKEFEALRTYDIKSINAVDNILDFKYFKTLMPELKKLHHDLNIFYEIKSNISYEQLCTLKAGGVNWIQPGIESLSTSVLKLMNKGVSAFQNIRLLKWAAELNIGVAWNILYGFPGENPEDYHEMAKIIPLLSHLMAPVFRCSRLRLDRFSYLFGNQSAVGLKAVRPLITYNMIYPFSPDIVYRLSYYFEYEYEAELNPEEYIKTIEEAVIKWYSQMGQSAFTCIERSEKLCIFDNRLVAKLANAELDGIEHDIFKECLKGCTIDYLSNTLSCSPADIMVVLKKFIDLYWAIELDGHFLTLAVPMDNSIPADIPSAILEPVLQAVYCERMKKMQKVQ